jgi:hypothetical protein
MVGITKFRAEILDFNLTGPLVARFKVMTILATTAAATTLGRYLEG